MIPSFTSVVRSSGHTKKTGQRLIGVAGLDLPLPGALSKRRATEGLVAILRGRVSISYQLESDMPAQISVKWEIF